MIAERVMDKTPHLVPPPGEKRPKPRQRTLLSGIVTYANGAHSFNCTIRDLSEIGARIVVGRNSLFPSNFYLINVRDRVVYEVKLIWNDGKEAGVTFKATIPLTAITDPALGYLKRLWLSQAGS